MKRMILKILDATHTRGAVQRIKAFVYDSFLMHCFEMVACSIPFLRTGLCRKNPPLRYFYCLTRGRSSELLHRVTCRFHPRYPLTEHSGILGDLTPTKVAEIASEIERNGFHVFDARLNSELCERLYDFGLQAESFPSPEPAVKPAVNRYDPDHPLATTHRFEEQTLLESTIVQEFASDPSVIAVSQAYLGCAPVFSLAAMWWSTSMHKVADTNAAQLFHFDMDRLKWLKFFVYLTDVTPETGPHCFIAGSHKGKAKPTYLMKKYPVRIPDQEFEKFYPQKDVVELCGPKGTIIAVDTAGYHKGKHLKRDHRLILQLEYANCLLGYPSEKVPVVTKVSRFGELCRKYPRLYSKLDIRQVASP